MKESCFLNLENRNKQNHQNRKQSNWLKWWADHIHQFTNIHHYISTNFRLEVTALYELPDSYPRMDPRWSGSRTCKSMWDNHYYTRAVCSLFGTLQMTEERCAVIEIASPAFRGICLVIQVCYMTNLNGQGGLMKYILKFLQRPWSNVAHYSK